MIMNLLYKEILLVITNNVLKPIASNELPSGLKVNYVSILEDYAYIFCFYELHSDINEVCFKYNFSTDRISSTFYLTTYFQVDAKLLVFQDRYLIALSLGIFLQGYQEYISLHLKVLDLVDEESGWQFLDEIITNYVASSNLGYVLAKGSNGSILLIDILMNVYEYKLPFNTLKNELLYWERTGFREESKFAPGISEEIAYYKGKVWTRDKSRRYYLRWFSCISKEVSETEPNWRKIDIKRNNRIHEQETETL